MPITEELKDNITKFTDKAPDDDIIRTIQTNPKYSDIGPTIQYYQKQGLKSGEILDKIMSAPSVQATVTPQAQPAPQVQPTPQVSPEQADLDKLNSTPMLRPGTITGMGGQGTVATPPSQLRQTAQGAVNVIPEALGGAASLASVAAGQPELAPVAGGMGAMAGRSLQSPLTSLIMPHATTSPGTAGEMLQTGLGGAAQGALNALGAKATPGGLAASEPALTAPGEDYATQARDYLTRRLLKPSSANPAAAAEAVQNVGTMKIPVGATGPELIEKGINDWSGRVDQLIDEAQTRADAAQGPSISGGTPPSSANQVDLHQIINPLFGLHDAYANAGMEEEAASVMKQTEAFMKLPQYQDPEAAQAIKQTIYQTLKDANWANISAGNATAQARKIGSVGIKQGLEDIAPELQGANEEIGQRIQARPYVATAADKYQDLGLRARGMAQLQQKGRDMSADLAANYAKSYGARPNVPAGTPSNIDELLGPGNLVAGRAIGDMADQRTAPTDMSAISQAVNGAANSVANAPGNAWGGIKNMSKSALMSLLRMGQ